MSKVSTAKMHLRTIFRRVRSLLAASAFKRSSLSRWNSTIRLHSGIWTFRYTACSHINLDLARYELHRVWVVEGKLKPGERHIYSRRVFYLDEDSWQIAVADNYDKDGK